MTDKQLMQETENNIEIATKALADAAVTAKELRIEMEERVPKIIHTTYALFEGDPARAQKAVLEMGYTKADIRACGYEVN
jgi:hypothetical protein